MKQWTRVKKLIQERKTKNTTIRHRFLFIAFLPIFLLLSGALWAQTVDDSNAAATQQASSNDYLPLSQSSRTLIGLGETATPELATGSVVSTSAGFDVACAPAASDMQNWWKSSPYKDIGIYLGGCDVHCVSPNGQNTCATNWTATPSKIVNTNLTPEWVTSVTNMGWGVIPLWVGPQAPCIGSGFWYISSDPESTGAYQADLAIAQANWLGIKNGIIYYDMEYYPTDGGSCSNSVISFLNSWTTELHAKGFLSGVYSQDNDFDHDIINTLPLPDDIWVAEWDSNRTVWNLGTLSDTQWANDQRIHQWNTESGEEIWGGTIFNEIDQDTVDARVIGNWTTSSPNFVLNNNAAITISTVGSSGTSNVTVTPANGFTGTVNLSCSISPAAAVSPTCAVPSSVTVSGTGASTFTLTVGTTATTQARTLPQRSLFWGGGESIIVCLLLWGVPRWRLSWQKFLGLFLLLAVGIGAIAGCGSGSSGGSGGGGGGTTVGTYTVTVIGIDQATGTIKSSTSVAAIVN
jgi:hypothetical protein